MLYELTDLYDLLTQDSTHYSTHRTQFRVAEPAKGGTETGRGREGGREGGREREGGDKGLTEVGLRLESSPGEVSGDEGIGYSQSSQHLLPGLQQSLCISLTHRVIATAVSKHLQT